MTKTWGLIFGVVFLLIGILGFVPGITTEEGMLLGIFHVDTIHNIVHILTGLIALAVMKKEAAAKTFFKVFGVIYGLVTIIGFIQGDTVLGIFTVNAADNILHLVVAAIALYVGFMGGKSAGSMSAPAAAPAPAPEAPAMDMESEGESEGEQNQG